VREQVLEESRRVLKRNGLFAFVDSLQLGDEAALDPILRRFPVDFHEPFYPNYISNPMEILLGRAGFQTVEKGLGFFSKVETAVPKRTVSRQSAGRSRKISARKT